MRYLDDVTGVADPEATVQGDLEMIDEGLYQRVATRVSGTPTIVTGPPTTGTYVATDLWRDTNGAEFVCTVGGTPGTWRQIRPAVVAATPGSPTTGYWIVRSDLNFVGYYWDGAAWQPIIPTALAGAVVYQGTWASNTNTPAIPAAAAGNKGYYYVVTGSVGSGHGYSNVPAVDFEAGDWLISNGSAWEKVDSTDKVASVAGKTGAVTLDTGDLTDMTAAGVAIATAADAAAQRTALGLGSMALETAGILSGSTRFSGKITPTALAANQDDWNPVGLAGATVIEIDFAGFELRGLDGGADGRIICLRNIGATDGTLKNGALTSTATMRFEFPADFPMLSKSEVLLQYSSTSGRWSLIGGSALSDDSVTNVKLANMANFTIKGRHTAGTGDPEDLTPAQVRAVSGITLVETVWIDGGSIVPRVTTGGALATTESTTNKVMNDTVDLGSGEFCQFRFKPPPEWDGGTFKAKFVWSAASGSGTVIFGLAALALSDGDTIDTAFGTQQTVTDTLLGTSAEHTTDATAAVTPSNTPAVGDTIRFQVLRTGGTLGVDAQLHGLWLQFTKTQQGSTAW